MQQIQYLFIRGNKMYILECIVTWGNTTGDPGILMDKYLPLFRLMANSIVENDKYQ